MQNLNKSGFEDLKLKMIRNNLFTKCKTKEIRNTTTKELEINLPKGYRYEH